MRSRIVERMTLTNAFQRALRDGEFFLEYQPQVRLADGSLEGFEALVRWRHPDPRTHRPDAIHPARRGDGLHRAARPLGARAGLPGGGALAATSAGPLSCRSTCPAGSCRTPSSVEDVRTALRFSGLAPHQLILEITESVLMVDPAATAQTLPESEEPRRPDRHRRLRHRVLLAQLPAPVPGRHPEDRQVVHRSAGRPVDRGAAPSSRRSCAWRTICTSRSPPRASNTRGSARFSGGCTATAARDT